jgi:hypothetical protein
MSRNLHRIGLFRLPLQFGSKPLCVRHVGEFAVVLFLVEIFEADSITMEG